MAQSKITAHVQNADIVAFETGKQEWHVQIITDGLEDGTETVMDLGTWIGTAGQIKHRFGQMEKWSDPTNEKKTWGAKKTTLSPVDLPVMEGVLQDS